MKRYEAVELQKDISSICKSIGMIEERLMILECEHKHPRFNDTGSVDCLDCGKKLEIFKNDKALEQAKYDYYSGLATKASWKLKEL